MIIWTAGRRSLVASRATISRRLFSSLICLRSPATQLNFKKKTEDFLRDLEKLEVERPLKEYLKEKKGIEELQTVHRFNNFLAQNEKEIREISETITSKLNKNNNEPNSEN